MNHINEIKLVMKKRKITCYRAAKEIGFSYVTLSKWLKYGGTPSYASEIKIEAWLKSEKNQDKQ